MVGSTRSSTMLSRTALPLLVLLAATFLGTTMAGKKNKGGAVAAQEAEHPDPYTVLEVSREATEAEIKKAFRKLSIKNHPDKGGDKVIFQKIQRAYEILSNEELRMVYDHAGHEGLDQHEKGQNAPASPFDAFFGGGQQRGVNKGPDAKVEMQVTMEDMYNGNDVSMSIKRRVVCRQCKGRETWKTEPCRECGECPPEIKMVQQQVAPGFVVQQQQQVPSEYRCKNEPKELKVTVEKGSPDGHEVRFKGASEQSPGQVPGDVVLGLKMKSHSVFTRKGNDLHMTMEISLKEALTGFTRTVKQLDGREILVEEKGITGPYSTKVVLGEGMPVHGVPSESGKLKIQMKVKFPKSLTSDQVEQLRTLLP
uniref:J domain-containing protein n=1 Tax=Hemiselmis andersenii TaxID=464988 RepID=A0A6U4WZX3_HEMAN|mmetsp:Transcript_14401/g.33298  ORF Transcript_14401/g.33298 Transcript_14401/m.33298 type:complete len:366 (-) Transcript_14401:139-1236(-)